MNKLFAVLFLMIFCLPPLYACDDTIIAGIEIGSKGIKGLAYKISGFDQDGYYKTEKLYDKKANVNTLGGLSNNLLTQEKMTTAAQAIDSMREELVKLSPKFLIVVASTAYQKLENKTEFEDVVLKASGKPLGYITSDEEIYYAMVSSLPQKRLAEAVLIDIGSGNTKIGYTSPVALNGFASGTLKYGTVSFKDAAKGEVTESTIKNLYRSEVAESLKKLIQDKPGMANPTRRIYIIGGSAWALTNLSRPQDLSRRFVRLSYDEAIQTNRKIWDGSITLDRRFVGDAQAEVTKIFDVFTPDDLKAGTTLLLNILNDLGGKKRIIIFPRESGWLLGYMFAQHNKDLARPGK